REWVSVDESSPLASPTLPPVAAGAKACLELEYLAPRTDRPLTLGASGILGEVTVGTLPLDRLASWRRQTVLASVPEQQDGWSLQVRAAPGVRLRWLARCALGKYRWASVPEQQDGWSLQVRAAPGVRLRWLARRALGKYRWASVPEQQDGWSLQVRAAPGVRLRWLARRALGKYRWASVPEQQDGWSLQVQCAQGKYRWASVPEQQDGWSLQVRAAPGVRLRGLARCALGKYRWASVPEQQDAWSLQVQCAQDKSDTIVLATPAATARRKRQNRKQRKPGRRDHVDLAGERDRRRKYRQTGACERGGYRNASSDGGCVCPPGFAGDVCEQGESGQEASSTP
ncbi:Zinc metalloproteinase nas-17, partial [Frankliniella fusca]